LALLWLLAVHDSAAAQEVSVRAYLDRNPVTVNQQFTFSIDVVGVRGLDGEPGFPALESHARYLGSNTSTSMQVTNGRTSVSLTLQYRWIATKEGTFEIPPVEVRAGGQTVRTESITMTVVAAGAAGGQQQGSSGGAPNSGPVVSPEDLFLVAEVDRTRVYENEPVLVSYRVFTRVNVNSYQVTTAPSTEGFWSEEIPIPQEGPAVEQVTRNGIRYASAIVRQVALFPTGAGARTIDPMGLEARVRVERNSRDVFSEFFGGRSLFGSLVPVVVESDPIQIEVLPLPAEQPDDFRGFVGDLGITTSLDRTTVEANDAVTFSVTVTGTGNLRTLLPPEFDVPADFEVFEPEVTESISRDGGVIRGFKRFDYVMIPRAPGDREVPSVSMAYFDPRAGRFSTASAPAIPLEVTGEAPVSPTGGVRSGVETLRQDIRFIRLGAPRLHAVDRRVLGSAGFWIVALLPMLAVAGALGLRRHQDRLFGDVAYARGRRASRVAKRRLAEARALATNEDPKAFYAEAARALQGFLADKLNIAEAGLMTDLVTRELKARGVSDQVVTEYLACIEHCDQKRFAPSTGGTEAAERFLDRTEAAMIGLDRELGG
jgi:BatD DUF11 like domain